MTTETLRAERLAKKNAVVTAEYFEGGAVRRRCSDGSARDDVQSGVLLAKTYTVGGRELRRETEFNPGILYSFVFPEDARGAVRCPCCGGEGSAAGFAAGCPWCGAYYNLEYAKDGGSNRHADYVVHEKRPLWLPVLLIIAAAVAVCAPLILLTGRTRGLFDALKGVGLGLLVGCAAALVFIALKSRGGVTAEGRRKLAKQAAFLERLQQTLAADGLPPAAYSNALAAALDRYYFGGAPETADVIDYDILDHPDGAVEPTADGAYRIETLLVLREVRCANSALSADTVRRRVRLTRSAGGEPLRPGLNVRACPYCGASLDLSADACAFCGRPLAYRPPFGEETVCDA